MSLLVSPVGLLPSKTSGITNMKTGKEEEEEVEEACMAVIN